MSGQRQKNRPEQGVLAFPVESRSDAPRAIERGTENASGEAPGRKPGWNRTTEGRSLRAGKLQAGTATSQGQQRETGSRRSRNTATVFDPGGSAKQAVHEAQQHIAEGYRWVVDLDWEKFFDRVNHDRLIAAVAKRVADEQPWGRPHCGCR